MEACLVVGRGVNPSRLIQWIRAANRLAPADEKGSQHDGDDLTETAHQASRPQHCLYFLPEPHGHGAFRPDVSMSKLGLRFGRFRTTGVEFSSG